MTPPRPAEGLTHLSCKCLRVLMEHPPAGGASDLQTVGRKILYRRISFELRALSTLQGRPHAHLNVFHVSITTDLIMLLVPF